MMNENKKRKYVRQPDAASARRLNDYFYFVSLVEHGGYGAASRATGVSKSNISRHLSNLEDRFGVRLIERSLNRFSVTEAGLKFYENCRSIMDQVNAAEKSISQWQESPRGRLTVSAHSGIAAAYLKNLIPKFALDNPSIIVELIVSDRPVDLIKDGIDVAFRVRSKIDSDVELVARPLGKSKLSIAGSPRALKKWGRPKTIQDLEKFPILSMSRSPGAFFWELQAKNFSHTFYYHPTFICSNFDVLLEAIKMGVGIALLPEVIYAPLVKSGELELLMPEYSEMRGFIYLTYTSRKVAPPAINCFVNYIIKNWID